METDRPLPARALSPVLFVGEVPLTEGETSQRHFAPFFALDPDRLEAGAPVTLGWPGQPRETRRETGFRYRPPPEVIAEILAARGDF